MARSVITTCMTQATSVRRAECMMRHYDVHNSPGHYDEYGVKGSTYERVPRHRAQCVDARLRMRVRLCMAPGSTVSPA